MTALVPILAVAALAQSDPLTGGKGPYRRLFLDPLVVESSFAVERVFHPLEKYPGNPLITASTPWEKGGSGPYLYGTVLGGEGKLRCGITTSWAATAAPTPSQKTASDGRSRRWG